MNLISERLDVDDYEEAVELFYQRNWTDGLPVVLPIRRRVEAMIAGGGRDPQESLGPVPPKGGAATVEKLAINAVMGGCLPEHFPVVLAALEALLDPAHNLNGVSQTTHMCVPLAIVNGPIARELGFNSRDGVFGNGYRANAAVGRAVRLALWNLGGAVPGTPTRPRSLTRASTPSASRRRRRTIRGRRSTWTAAARPVPTR
jgi:hypothetical protein